MRIRTLLGALVLTQSLLTLRVIKRWLEMAQGERIQPAYSTNGAEVQSLAVIVPVLNEYHRLGPCLEGLLQQGEEVTEILIVDGGSSDGTQGLVAAYSQRDARLRFIDASQVPVGWNGKSWSLHKGFQQLTPTSDWILTLDADVRPTALLARSLLVHAQKTGLKVLSVATLQEITGPGQHLLHPALLTTLVYRFGIPGRSIRKPQEVQANGQCFLIQRTLLEAYGGFACTRTSLCEDVTLARTLAVAGHLIGFYETNNLISVEMYDTWQEMWQNWTRSLPMHDHFSGLQTFVGWLEVLLVQALPLPLFLALLRNHRRARVLFWLSGIGVVLRLGVLYGTARVYHRRSWWYWLSPFCDLPVALKLGCSALQRRHTWRGRTIIRGGLT